MALAIILLSLFFSAETALGSDLEIYQRELLQKYNQQHTEIQKKIAEDESIDSDDYPNALKELYFNIYQAQGEEIKSFNEEDPEIETKVQEFKSYGNILSELEYQEGKVDKYNDEVMAYRQLLLNKIYYFKKSLSLQYVSWQQEATLKNASGEESGLIITNRGFCAGGEAGIENYLFHFYMDGCFLAGSGGVKNYDQDLVDEYQQSDVPAYGVKLGPGASMIVSSSRSRIGIKLPMIYTVQKLTKPDDPSYTVKEGPSFAVMTSLYGRWQFKQWYFQTEFGKYLGKDQTFWGLGIGKDF